ELLKDPIVSKKLKKYYKTINLESPDQISTLLFDILGIKSKKLTAGGKQSTDAEVLSEIDHPWVQKYSKYKKLIKVKDTFLKGIRTEITDENILHTFYHLHTTRTGRSSSQSPNWQNIPKRDEEAKKITRSGIKVRKNEKIGEADYGALEVNIIACTSKEPTLIDYCSDANADPHRDTAADLFLIPSDQVPKKVRFITKNGYVFPEFYGSYYANCAENLWYNSADLTMNDGMPVHDYLREKGIKCLRKPSDKKGQASKGTFEYHVKECEEVFWERFPIVKEWQQDTIDFYYKYGYVENMFGFRRRGYISRNQIVNTPIQGSAFHLLLWSFIQAKKLEKKEKWESKIRGQIHDSILFTATQNEEQHVLNSLKYIMIEKATKTFDWIVVPLTVEIELSKFGGNWANLEKIEI
ncbi:MAG: DNA polymerase, partial [Bacteroidales bacterium]